MTCGQVESSDVVLNKPGAILKAGRGDRALPTRRLVLAYPTFLHRLYCLLRFRIIKSRFLAEIGQYLPTEGRAIEIGCGFGLFALHFGAAHPGLRITGVDLDERRIAIAEHARSSLGIENVEFAHGDARRLALPADFDAIYMLDLLHHIPLASGRELLALCHERLTQEGVLIIKDVDTRPLLKMAFTWILDVVMTGGELPNYRSKDSMIAELRDLGFNVVRHSLIDFLPYPHELYICTKTPRW